MTTSAGTVVAQLPTRSVLLALQEIAEDIGTNGTDSTPMDPDEAEALLSALAHAAGERPPARLSEQSDAQVLASGRLLLVYIAEDPDTAEQAEAVLSDPPSDEQMSVESAAAAVVVLGGLIAWLQTKVDIKIKRTGGKTDFDFRLTKSAASPGVLRDVVAIITRLFGGGGPTEPPQG
ncbi:hypothetical protein [Streptomyces sp. NPDC001815]|uniref:hypothetical protein n=1 Tax=Streptomyces sp. NPDC001815 TaxID=3154526 RepID=UPI00331B92AF